MSLCDLGFIMQGFSGKFTQGRIYITLGKAEKEFQIENGKCESHDSDRDEYKDDDDSDNINNDNHDDRNDNGDGND